MTQKRLKEDIFFEEREVLGYGYIIYIIYYGGVELWVYIKRIIYFGHITIY